MNEIDLLDAWNARTVDTEELEHLLLNYFKKVGFAESGYAIYGEDPAAPGLVLVYKGGRPHHAYPGAGFSEADFTTISDRIRNTLLVGDAVEIGRRVLFTTLRVDGFYRYRDRFQLVPVPPGAPKPEMAMLAMNPFLLEVSYRRSADSLTSMLRKEKAEREIELLCAVFLWLPIERLGNVRCRWVLNPSDGTQLTSCHRQEGYHWPGDRPIRDAFSMIDGLEPMGFVDPAIYYARFNYSYEDRLDLPANVSEMFDAFYSLAPPSREQFLRACYWFHHASNVWSMSNSAAFVAMISAIETLMPPAKAGDPCPTCRRRAGSGPTAQFEAFVDVFANGCEVTIDQRKIFYRLRSALSHGGRLLDHDQGAWAVGVTGALEMMNLRALSGVARAVLHTWLIGYSTSSH